MFQEKVKNPFGRERAVRFSFNSETGYVKMAGSIWRYDSPDDHVSPNVLRAMVDARYLNPKEVITFRLTEMPKSTEELNGLIETYS